MDSVGQLFALSDVLLDCDVPNATKLFATVSELWAKSLQGVSAEAIVDGLTAREDIGSTALGQGVAIPHARVKGLSHAVAAFVRPVQPIEFDAPDGKPVSFFFVMLVPVPATEQHLQVLASIAAMFSVEKFRDQLGSAKTPDEIHQLFSEWRDRVAAEDN